MKPKTSLRILTDLLSGKGKKLFPNQVVLYHALFAFTQKRLCTESLIQQVQDIARQRSGQPLSVFINQYPELQYILLKSLDGDSGNIGRHINNIPGCPIPVFHKEQYLSEDSQNEIIRRLQIITELFLACPASGQTLSETEFSLLLGSLHRTLAGRIGSDTLTHTAVLTPAILAHIIYETVRHHLICEADVSFPGSTDSDTPALLIDREAHRMEWEKCINGFGSHSIDRFLALQKLAETNVFAAEELANTYYYGAEYHVLNEGIGNSGVCRINPDYSLAARYFRYAADCIPHSLPASWSLGYMLLNHKFPDVPPDESLILARRYLSYGLAEGYAPSINGLGNLERRLGDQLLALSSRTDAQEKEMTGHFTEAFRYYLLAGEQNWPYANINLAEFLENERYREQIIPKLSAALALTESGCDPLYYWRRAAGVKNPWAMDRLADALFHQGNHDEARSLWEATAALHYPDGWLHLACRYYSTDGISPDPELWLKALVASSDCGSAKASLLLADYWKETQPGHSLDRIEKAEQQNFCKFNAELYRQIQELKKLLTTEANMRPSIHRSHKQCKNK